MRANGLSAPHHPRRVRGNKAHDGRMTTDLPDTMWGTDATHTLTRAGSAPIVIPVDHCIAECIGIHAAEHGTRHEVFEPRREGVRRHFGDDENGVATGLALRPIHVSQYMSRDFQREFSFLGRRPSESTGTLCWESIPAPQPRWQQVPATLRGLASLPRPAPSGPPSPWGPPLHSQPRRPRLRGPGQTRAARAPQALRGRRGPPTSPPHRARRQGWDTTAAQR